MDLAKLSYRDIEELCAQDLPENMRLDYKRELSASDPQKQVVKIVSSFANTQGGIAVFGVGTKPNSKFPEWPSDGMPADQNFEKRVTRWCIEHVVPPITPFIGYVPHPEKADRAFAVVRTEMSWLTPHTVEGGIRLYLRRGDNSDPVDATFAEIELLRNRRQAALELESRHREDLMRRTKPHRFQPFLKTLLLMPQFSSEDALPWRNLYQIARRFADEGFISWTSPLVRPYSFGVVGTGDPDRAFALTTRGAFGCGIAHGQSGTGESILEVKGILSWARFAAKGSAILAESAGYWGNHHAEFRATGYGDIPVINKLHTRDLEVGRCADMMIEVQSHWAAYDSRASWIKAAVVLGRKLLWAFGVNATEWEDEGVINILKALDR